MGRLGIIAFVTALAGTPSLACSISYICPHHGPAMRADLTVEVKLLGRPVPGVKITVLGSAPEGVDLEGETGPQGTLEFNRLPPGNYDFWVQKLGVPAEHGCFHVLKLRVGLERKTITHELGFGAPEVRRVAGQMVLGDTLAGLQHPPDIVLPATKLTLQDPVSGAQFKTVTDQDGKFAFEYVPAGGYVLQADEAPVPNTSNNFVPVGLLVHVNPKATRSTIILERNRPGGGGDCFGDLLHVREAAIH